MIEQEWRIAGGIGYLIATALFGILLILSLINWRRRLPAALFSISSGLTALWAGLGAYAILFNNSEALITALIADIARSLGWLAVLAALITPLAQIRTAGDARKHPQKIIFIFVGVSIIVFAAMTTAILMASQSLINFDSSTLQAYIALGFLIAAICGVMLVENIWRNGDKATFWRNKFLFFGIGGLFVVDIGVFASAAMFQRIDPSLFALRGLAAAIAAPMIIASAKRATEWAPKIHVSRGFTFYSAALLFSGGYLLTVAGAGYYVRLVGGRWGDVAQFAILFGSTLGLLLIITSGQFRARIKRFLSQNFYSSIYDYGKEWRAFIDRIEGEDDAAELGERIIRAVAEAFEVPNALLWIRREDQFVPHAAWNRPFFSKSISALETFAQNLDQVVSHIDLSEGRTETDELWLPDWIDDIDYPWILAPLRRRGRVIAFLVLTEPRARHTLAEEDINLLNMLTRQAGSYLAEGLMQTELSQARQFAAFNRQTTYVAHDLKNLVSQLSLMISNAHKFKSNPEFIADMIETIENSLKTMRRMLNDIKNTGNLDQFRGQNSNGHNSRICQFKVQPVLHEIINAMELVGCGSGQITSNLDESEDELLLNVDPDRFTASVRNLIQNACDASAEIDLENKRPVLLNAKQDKNLIVIEIIDTNGGMSEEFVRNELFKPFRSTKDGGYGIGAFEAREFARENGGKLEVDTKFGKGTTMRLFLPLSVPE